MTHLGKQLDYHRCAMNAVLACSALSLHTLHRPLPYIQIYSRSMPNLSIAGLHPAFNAIQACKLSNKARNGYTHTEELPEDSLHMQAILKCINNDKDTLDLETACVSSTTAALRFIVTNLASAWDHQPCKHPSGSQFSLNAWNRHPSCQTLEYAHPPRNTRGRRGMQPDLKNGPWHIALECLLEFPQGKLCAGKRALFQKR